MNDGSEEEYWPGDVLYVPPGHNSWVVGNEPYIGIEIATMDNYAKKWLRKWNKSNRRYNAHSSTLAECVYVWLKNAYSLPLLIPKNHFSIRTLMQKKNLFIYLFFFFFRNVRKNDSDKNIS